MTLLLLLVHIFRAPNCAAFLFCSSKEIRRSPDSFPHKVVRRRISLWPKRFCPYNLEISFWKLATRLFRAGNPSLFILFKTEPTPWYQTLSKHLALWLKSCHDQTSALEQPAVTALRLHFQMRQPLLSSQPSPSLLPLPLHPPSQSGISINHNTTPKVKPSMLWLGNTQRLFPRMSWVWRRCSLCLPCRDLFVMRSRKMKGRRWG